MLSRQKGNIWKQFSNVFLIVKNSFTWIKPWKFIWFFEKQSNDILRKYVGGAANPAAVDPESILGRVTPKSWQERVITSLLSVEGEVEQLIGPFRYGAAYLPPVCCFNEAALDRVTLHALKGLLLGHMTPNWLSNS